jgi:hypothetical protein
MRASGMGGNGETPSARRAAAQPRRAAIAAFVWLFAFAFYGLTGPGHSSSNDGMLIFLTARNLWYRGQLSVPFVYGTDQLRRPGVDGKLYAKFGPGLVIADLPMLAVARVAGHFHLLRDPQTGADPKSLRADEFWVQLTDAWIVASLIALLVLLCGTFGASVRASLAVALLVGLASPLWLYARLDATEALQSLALTGALYFLTDGRRRSDHCARDVAAGACYAVAVITKLFNVILLPSFLLFYGITWRRRRSWRAPIGFLSPVALSLMVIAAYNFIRFGSALDTGYDLADERFSHSMIAGAASMIFSPCYGLVLFWPGVFLAVAGARRHVRRFPAESMLVLVIFVTLLGAYGMWWAYQGFYYGPRFIVPAIPLLATFALPVVSSATRRAKIAFAVSFFLGFSVQALAATTSHWQQIVHGIFWSIECKTTEDCVDDPHIAPLRVATWYLRALYWRDRSTERTRMLLREPPWKDAVPWRDPDDAVRKLEATLGVDFWAAPERWRLQRYYLWVPNGGSAIPSSRPLTVVFLLLAVSGAAPLVRAVLARDPEGERAAHPVDLDRAGTLL